MSRITVNDQIFATLMMRGRVLAQATMSGVSSFSSIMEHLRGVAPDANGLGTVSVRNTSQGWSASQTVFLR